MIYPTPHTPNATPPTQALPLTLPRTLRLYLHRLADAGVPLPFTQIVAATPGVNQFRLLCERGLVRNVVPNYIELPVPEAPPGGRVPNYVPTDAARPYLGDRCPGWAGIERRGALAVWCAAFVLGRRARPAVQRDQQHVRALAARVLYDFGGLSWSDVALACYRRRVHNTAVSAARRWAATPEATLARAILTRTIRPEGFTTEDTENAEEASNERAHVEMV